MGGTLKARSILAGAAVAIAASGAGSAHAETLGQYGVPRSGRICVEDNGYRFWNDTLPPWAKAMRAHAIANVVVWDECDGANPLDHVIHTVYSNSPSEPYCARTERTWKWNGSKWVVASTDIRINLAFYSGCRATAYERSHVMWHELGHAFSLTHADGPGVMTSWAYSTYTTADYAHLREAGYSDLK